MSLNRAQLLAAAARRNDTVSIDGVGDVRLQSLTLAEVSDWQKAAGDDNVAAMRKLVALCLIDDDGARLFADDADVAGLDWSAVDAIAQAALRLNKLGEDKAAAAKN